MAAEENSVDITPSFTMLTEAQQQFLDACESEFANRYTDDDADYVREKNARMPTPPIMDPWYNKPRRSYDWSKQGNSGGRRQQNWGGRNERYESGGYQQHRQNYRYQQRHRPY